MARAADPRAARPPVAGAAEEQGLLELRRGAPADRHQQAEHEGAELPLRGTPGHAAPLHGQQAGGALGPRRGHRSRGHPRVPEPAQEQGRPHRAAAPPGGREAELLEDPPPVAGRAQAVPARADEGGGGGGGLMLQRLLRVAGGHGLHDGARPWAARRSAAGRGGPQPLQRGLRTWHRGLQRVHGRGALRRVDAALAGHKREGAARLCCP
mmetsp:Transcript_94643/g.276693  ORF Transcript_94643/g.276693 Transcript_94643/m.276693 type:complete len:210 (-) Transcript_94643:627-1256(-)